MSGSQNCDELERITQRTSPRVTHIRLRAFLPNGTSGGIVIVTSVVIGNSKVYVVVGSGIMLIHVLVRREVVLQGV